MLKRVIRCLNKKNVQLLQVAQLSEWGNAVGKGGGGGGGGTIRDAGGSFGRVYPTREEDFYIKKQREQLKILKKNVDTKPEAPLAEAQNKN